MGEKVASALCRNLIASPPPHLDEEIIRHMQERGLLSVVLVSNKQIQKLNHQWMGKDAPTDVLSFPLSIEPPPAELPWEVGELVISLEKTEEQALEYAHSSERELAFLLVHGMLHILGFDHMSPEEEKEMFGRQKRILADAGFNR